MAGGGGGWSRASSWCRSVRVQLPFAETECTKWLPLLCTVSSRLDLSVAERLGNCLASCLARSPSLQPSLRPHSAPLPCRQGSLSFVLCLSCLRALSELFAAGGSKVRQSLSPMLRPGTSRVFTSHESRTGWPAVIFETLNAVCSLCTTATTPSCDLAAAR